MTTAALPTISVVTPSLNQAALLEGTLDSVVSQDYAGLEYVVVDGGSTDASVDVIRKYERGITRWSSEPDAGHADALNKGFSGTTGEVMAWINSSDIYYPWTLETVGRVFAELPEVEWLEGMPTFVAEGQSPKGVGTGMCNRYGLLLGHESTIQQESVFWRRSLWERAGGRLDSTLRLACDYELWLRFSRHAPLYHLATVLAGFRFHDDRRGHVSVADYVREARAVRDRERDLLARRDRARVQALGAMRKTIGREGEMLLGRSGLLRWHRYPRVVFDYSAHRWQVA